MKNFVQKAFVSTKNFVAAHKNGIIFTTGAATALAVTIPSLRSHNEFLKEHDLYNEYYNTPQS